MQWLFCLDIRVLFFSLMKAEGKINPFHMLLLFLFAYLYYDSISEALLVGPPRHTQCFTGMYCKHCKRLHTNYVRNQQVNSTNRYGRKIRE